MRMRGLRLMWVLCLFLLGTAGMARAQAPVVKMLFFYSPSCDKCEAMIEDYWPSMFEKYGAQLEVLFIDVSYQQNLEIWQAAEDDAGVAAKDHGVPGVIIGQNLIIGDEPIKSELDARIDAYLAQGGVGYPLLGSLAGTPSPEPSVAAPSPTPPPAPGGSSGAGLRPLLAGIAAALAVGVALLWSRRRRKGQP